MKLLTTFNFNIFCKQSNDMQFAYLMQFIEYAWCLIYDLTI